MTTIALRVYASEHARRVLNGRSNIIAVSKEEAIEILRAELRKNGLDDSGPFALVETDTHEPDALVVPDSEY